MGHIKMMKLKERSKELYALLEKEMPEEKKAGDKAEKELDKSINEIDKEIKTKGDSSVLWKGKDDDKKIRAIHKKLLERAKNAGVNENPVIIKNLSLLDRLASHYEGKINIQNEIKNLTRETLLKIIKETRKIILEEEVRLKNSPTKLSYK